MGSKGRFKGAAQLVAEQAVKAFFRELFRALFKGWLP